MVILGIDPGSRRIGFGVIKKERGRVALLDAGILPITGTNDGEALKETRVAMERLIKKYRPEMVGIEKLYFVKNRKTGTQVLQFRGVILLSCLEHGLEVQELTPNEVKLGIAGYGLADKQAVAKMVRAALGLPALTLIDDAFDALAVALVTAQSLAQKLRGQ